MSYDLQPSEPHQPPAAPVEGTPLYCHYCGAQLSEFYYFCLACATPYKNVDTVITPSRPRTLTDQEMVERKAPHVKTIFWTYFGVVLGVGLLSSVLFREDRPDLLLLLNEVVLSVTTIVFAWIHWPSLAVQLKRFGFNRWQAYAGMAVLPPLLLLDYGYHEFLTRALQLDGEDLLAELREAGVTRGVLIVTFCVMPAVIEEISFRGMVQHWLQTAIKPWKALVTASAMFALIHFSILSFPYLFLVGVCLGWLKQKTNSLYPSMVFHFLHNFAVIELFH